MSRFPSDPVCLFCRISSGEIPADTMHEDDQVLAFRDINPQAPTHVLVIPRAHIPSAAELPTADPEVAAQLFRVVADLAAREGLADGWRVVTNVGADAGQSVGHLHLHLLGGRRLGWPPG